MNQVTFYPIGIPNTTITIGRLKFDMNLQPKQKPVPFNARLKTYMICITKKSNNL